MVVPLQKGRLGDARRYVQAIIDDAASDPSPYKLGYMNTMLAGYLVDAEHRLVLHGPGANDDLCQRERGRHLRRDDREAAVEDRYAGLDLAPLAFTRMMSGRNVGKVIVDVT